jgi:hypothetical protein
MDTNPRMSDLRRAQQRFRQAPTLDDAQTIMWIATHFWRAGEIGDATYTREMLEPVRAYLLAGNTPRPGLLLDDEQRGALETATMVLETEGFDESAAVVRAMLKAPQPILTPLPSTVAQVVASQVAELDGVHNAGTIEATARDYVAARDGKASGPKQAKAYLALQAAVEGSTPNAGTISPSDAGLDEALRRDGWMTPGELSARMAALDEAEARIRATAIVLSDPFDVMRHNQMADAIAAIPRSIPTRRANSDGFTEENG